MTVELGQLKDGRLLLMSDRSFPAQVLRVEYYREQRLFMLVYDTPDQDTELMRYEITEEIAKEVEPSPDIMVVAMAEGNKELYGYDVPLIQIGT